MKTLQEKKSFMLEDLRDSQTRSSEIPEQLVHSTSENNKYKVRKNRFGGIVHGTEYICYCILTDEKYAPVKKELMDSLSAFCNDDFRNRLTTKEDIEKGDEMIERLIEVLESVE